MQSKRVVDPTFKVASKTEDGKAFNESLSFLVMGDWGGKGTKPYTTEGQLRSAVGMNTVAEKIGSQFVIGLGDNMYTNGVTDEYSERFSITFEKVYTGNHLQTLWELCAGNHDYNGNVTAQVAYSLHSTRWNLPSLYRTWTHTVNFDSPQKEKSQHEHDLQGKHEDGGSVSLSPSSVLVQYVLLDTILLVGQTNEDLLGAQPEGPLSVLAAENQWVWLEQVLSTSEADYLIVGGHYPVWSVSSHGPTQSLVDRLKPLLEKYDVTAYVCGHDHNLQFISERRSQGANDDQVDNHMDAYADASVIDGDTDTQRANAATLGSLHDSNAYVDYHLVGAVHSVDTSMEHQHAVPEHALQFFYGGTVKVNAGTGTGVNDGTMDVEAGAATPAGVDLGVGVGVREDEAALEGAGAGKREADSPPDEHVHLSYTNYKKSGFASMTIDKAGLHTYYYDGDGVLLFTAPIHPSRTQKPSARSPRTSADHTEDTTAMKIEQM